MSRVDERIRAHLLRLRSFLAIFAKRETVWRLLCGLPCGLCCGLPCGLCCDALPLSVELPAAFEGERPVSDLAERPSLLVLVTKDTMPDDMRSAGRVTTCRAAETFATTCRSRFIMFVPRTRSKPCCCGGRFWSNRLREATKSCSVCSSFESAPSAIHWASRAWMRLPNSEQTGTTAPCCHRGKFSLSSVSLTQET